MHHKFKQAVCLEKKDYARGVHDLPESVLELLSKNQTFLKYKKLGLIEEVLHHHVHSDKTVLENNKKLADEILAPKVEAPVEAKSAESMDESSIEAAAEEVKEQASSKKSKKR